MKFTIDRKTWLRGEGGAASMLLRPEDNKMCCLGFYGEACGVPRSKLINVKSLDGLKNLPNSMNWMMSSKSPSVAALSFQLMRINDDANILFESKREEKIKEIFAAQGIEVEFIN